MAKSSNLAYEAVRARIIEGRYPPQSHLREAAIAAELGISRTPVRDALRRLAIDGYVTMRPNQGAFVTAESNASLSDLISVRAELAGLAAQGLVLHAGSAVLAELGEIVRQMSLIDPERMHGAMDETTQLNMRFHALVFAHCGNAWLERLLNQTSNVAIMQRAYFAYSSQDWARAVARYADLAEAVRTGDAAWAGATFRTHFLASRNAILKSASHGQSIVE